MESTTTNTSIHMKPTKQILEQKIEEILSYLLCHNMADMDGREFCLIARNYHSLRIQYENFGIKSYGRGSHLDSIRPLR